MCRKSFDAPKKTFYRPGKNIYRAVKTFYISINLLIACVEMFDLAVEKIIVDKTAANEIIYFCTKQKGGLRSHHAVINALANGFLELTLL